MEAIIGDIGRYAIHDGPGIRTTVFFKGCPMHCPWCHNPEFIRPQPEILFYADRCIGCGECVDRCPESAIDLNAPQRIDRRRCTACGECTPTCPTRALAVAGTRYGVEDLVAVLLRDRLFYDASGGGVTLSGGEPTLQMAFMARLLRRLKAEGLHTVLETGGFFPFAPFQAECLDFIDLIYFDLKISDQGRHQRITGVDNRLIWSTLAHLARWAPDRIVPRIPLIPGYTATRENLIALSGRIREMGLARPVLLPYHPFGRSKAVHVGRQADAALPRVPMSAEELARWSACVEPNDSTQKIAKEENDAD
ncbi:glycyl-radical enzyme activating protein [Desulfosarcina ovata subsp. sediminis]|uniref:Glycyl-radical enzyme activating protein n=1 Tax=Desulfosarcina ovata subsp. sediminis TaxID=885957 RepID=A0A5K7ZUD7_9BACT|nr:glycyl-radical enzyme activating protein [Desulfosarcina ovata]BBO83845.1 glycyl-radical enzyme activating protein [Desulfosarcina ovata subsp. sediminis]